MYTIIAAIVTGVATVAAVFVTGFFNNRKLLSEIKSASELSDTKLQSQIDKSQELTDMKIKQLAETTNIHIKQLAAETRMHNNFAQEIPVIKQRLTVLENQRGKNGQ
jgi:FtsZ-interacting cell division protein ZipA